MTDEVLTADSLRAVKRDGRWSLVGSGPGGIEVVNDYLGYLADRGYSPRTVRAYAFDLLAFARWLVDEGLAVDEVSTEVLLRFLAFCRATALPGRPGGNVYSIRDGRNAGYAATTINRRLAAISGLFSYRGMRDGATEPGAARRPAARRAAAGEQGGLLGSPARTEATLAAAGAGTAAAAPRPGPSGDHGAAGQLPHRSGPGDRGVDAVLRAAFGRGARSAGARCGHRPQLGSGYRQGR